MAISGRKQTDLQGSLDVGSAEDFDNECEPCLSIGQHVEAHGFCVQCQEYLCKTCHDCHKRTKISRNHQILGQDEFYKIQTAGKSYKECTEQCPLHQKEFIKFHCPKHACLGCNDCMTIGHRNCKIDYIPETCERIADGKEFNEIMMKLNEKLKEAEEVSKKAERSNNDINDINKQVIKEIAEFRVEINDHLNQMQQDILSNVEGKKSNNKEIVRKVTDTCGNIISNVKKLQSSLCASKSNNQNCQLYIDIKRAEAELKSDELIEANKKMINMNIQYSFQRSADLENLLSKEIVFGKLIKYPHSESTRKKNTIDHLILKNDITVKTKLDEKICCITGCAVLPPNKLVLADFNNKKVKVVSVKEKLVLEEKTLKSEPWGIASMSKTQIVVTMPGTGEIHVMTSDDKLSLIRRIKVDANCYGVAFNQDRIYVVCLNPSSVVVLTTYGDLINSIPLYFLSSYIAVKKDSNFLYISVKFNNRLVSVSLQGNVSGTYEHDDFKGPKGMCLFDDGSLLVCSYRNGTIHQVKDNLKEGKIMHNDIANPRLICYSADNDEVYVGCYGDQLKFLSTK